jgi:hypothetical protein
MSSKQVVPIRLDERHLQILDDLRRVEPDIPTRSEMARRLIERAGGRSAVGKKEPGSKK